MAITTMTIVTAFTVSPHHFIRPSRSISIIIMKDTTKIVPFKLASSSVTIMNTATIAKIKENAASFTKTLYCSAQFNDWSYGKLLPELTPYFSQSFLKSFIKSTQSIALLTVMILPLILVATSCE